MRALIGPGTFVAVVGPSGVGKDSLIHEARRRAPVDVVFPRRYVTRPPGPGEEHHPLSPGTFVARSAAGDFALEWAAHGLRYGIAREVDDHLRAGRCVVVNVSRSVLATLRERYRRVHVVRITVSEDVRRTRLQSRGRESAAEVAGRVHRIDPAPDGGVDTEISNDRSIAEGGDQLLAVVLAARASALPVPAHLEETP